MGKKQEKTTEKWDDFSISVRIPKEYKDSLQRYADSLRISFSDAVRFAIRELIERDGQKK